MRPTLLPKSAPACGLLLAAAGLSLSVAAPAAAQSLCNEIPNAVIGIGGSAGTPFIKAIAVELAKAGSDITVVYSDPGACEAMNGIVKDQALTKSAKYWDATGKESTCTFASGSQIKADWGSMAQEAGTCQGVSLPAGVSDDLGPISGFSIIAPTASTNYAITADAIYYIYGFGVGNGHDVKPWTVPASIASRTTTSAAGLLLAKASGIPESRPLFGFDVLNNQGAINYVTTPAVTAAGPDTGVGFCSLETVESGTNREKVRTLAFQAKGQKVAFFPDSTDTATDKKNLREGRYFLWGPHHFFARIDATTKAFVNPKVEKLVGYFTGKTPLPGAKSYLDVVIDNNTIPQCAMKVTRKGDMGPLEPFQPSEPCGCYFDNKKGVTGACKACTGNSECSGDTPVCRHGFCEVK